LSRIELAYEVADDFDRILNHLTEFNAKDRAERIGEIVQAIGVLENNPLIGRPVERPIAGKMNELIIGRDAHGYVALYRYIAAVDTVFVLAIRAQREAGYVRK
jgi:toxin ParE1/3/4